MEFDVRLFRCSAVLFFGGLTRPSDERHRRGFEYAKEPGATRVGIAEQLPVKSHQSMVLVFG